MLPPAAVVAAESELLTATLFILAAYGNAPRSTRGRPAHSRANIIRRAMDYMVAKQGEPVFIDQLATFTGVCPRTLRTAFHDYFGVGPTRYLKLRQLHLVHQALREADPTISTVTAIATRLGVWELGRFAREYRSLFEEVPSATLYHGLASTKAITQIRARPTLNVHKFLSRNILNK